MRALGRLVVAAEHRAMKTSASASRYLALQTPCAMAKTVVSIGGYENIPPPLHHTRVRSRAVGFLVLLWSVI